MAAEVLNPLNKVDSLTGQSEPVVRKDDQEKSPVVDTNAEKLESQPEVEKGDQEKSPVVDSQKPEVKKGDQEKSPVVNTNTEKPEPESKPKVKKGDKKKSPVVDTNAKKPESKPEVKKGHRKGSSVGNSEKPALKKLEDHPKGDPLDISGVTRQLNWKINTPPTSIDDKDALKEYLTTPHFKKIDLRFSTSIAVTARNLKGVTVKDALDAIYKQKKKQADDELTHPYLKGFLWDPTDDPTCFFIGLQTEAQAPQAGKKKKKGGNE